MKIGYWHTIVGQYLKGQDDKVGFVRTGAKNTIPIARSKTPPDETTFKKIKFFRLVHPYNGKETRGNVY